MTFKDFAIIILAVLLLLALLYFYLEYRINKALRAVLEQMNTYSRGLEDLYRGSAAQADKYRSLLFRWWHHLDNGLTIINRDAEEAMASLFKETESIIHPTEAAHPPDIQDAVFELCPICEHDSWYKFTSDGGGYQCQNCGYSEHNNQNQSHEQR